MPATARYLLKLYIAGHNTRSERAIVNVKHICEMHLNDGYQLIIVDVLEQPQLAKAEQILATPTLIRALPPPGRRVVGDLSDTERVLAGLELPSRLEAAPKFGSSGT
jgi:circadian clock protein KaiB